MRRPMPEPIPLYPPPARMTEAEYEVERTKLRETYGESNGQAGAKREQALAILFERSHWTQEELAKKEGKSQAYISRLLRFGGFINIMPMGIIPETVKNSLNERKFRTFWDQTDKLDGDEAARFTEVARLIAEDAATKELMLRKPLRPPISPKIVEQFADGAWHHLKTIAEAVAEGDEEHVTMAMQNMMKAGGVAGGHAERRKYGKSYQFRIFPTTDKKVSATEIHTKLGPILKRLEIESKKNMATMDIGAVKLIFFDLKKLVDGWIA